MHWKHRQQLLRRTGLVVGCCIAAMSSGPANANALAAVVNIPAQTFVAMSVTSMLCVSMTYDQNGNRLSQTVSAVTTSTTNWGAGTYGCFVWKQSA